MKATKLLFGILTIIGPLLGGDALVNAESFIGPTSSTNRFLIGKNESVLIDTVSMDPSLGGELQETLVVSNIAYDVELIGGNAFGGGPAANPTSMKLVPYAIPGPAELILSHSCAIHFARLTNSSMQMIQWVLNTNTITVSVPTGKTIQFFSRVDCSCNPLPVATLSSGTQSFDIVVSPGDLIQGPITVSFNYSKQQINSTPDAFVSYWFVEDVFQNPNTVLSLGAGVPNVLVQKSADLNHWQPVATLPVTLGSNSFYRLQISP